MIDILLRLAPRERLLLGVLVGLVLPLAVVFLVLLPLQDRRVAAQTAFEDARALDLWLAARVAEKTALEAAGNSGPRPAIGLSGIERSLIGAGLRDRVTDLADRAGGGAALRFDAVGFDDLMVWLSSSDPDWGYDIAAFRIVRGDTAGIVAADLLLEPQQDG